MRKTIFICAFLFLAAGPGMLLAQQNEQSINQVHNAIRNGNAGTLASFFNSTIDLELGTTDGNYSRNQAEMIVRDFFSKNPAKSFTVKHQGSSDDGSKYSIGLYNTTKNQSFRVYILMKKADAGLRIHQLQFEEE